jgi:hypothetical protein
MSKSTHRPALFVSLLLAGATGSVFASSKDDQDFAGLLGLLPGTYQNFTQANADKNAGIDPAHGKELLTVIELEAQVLAEHVYYVVEASAEDSHRIFSERLWVLEQAKGAVAIQSVYSFVQPERWRAGLTSPELFQALVPSDVRRLSGCEVIWHRNSVAYTGANNGLTCTLSAGADEPNYHLVQQLWLGGEQFSISEVRTDELGKPLGPAYVDPIFRFVRRAVAAQ